MDDLISRQAAIEAIQTSWAFTQLGCTLKGMTEVHGTKRDFQTGEYEKVPAFLFSL